MPESDGEEFNTGLLIIDVFTKFATVVPVKSKRADDILETIKQGFKSMGKLPEMLYTDDEGSFHSKQAVAYYRENKIKHLITRTHAPYAECAIRTIKAMLYKRLEAKPREPWYGDGVIQRIIRLQLQDQACCHQYDAHRGETAEEYPGGEVATGSPQVEAEAISRRAAR